MVTNGEGLSLLHIVPSFNSGMFYLVKPKQNTLTIKHLAVTRLSLQTYIKSVNDHAYKPYFKYFSKCLLKVL